MYWGGYIISQFIGWIQYAVVNRNGDHGVHLSTDGHLTVSICNIVPYLVCFHFSHARRTLCNYLDNSLAECEIILLTDLAHVFWDLQFQSFDKNKDTPLIDCLLHETTSNFVNVNSKSVKKLTLYKEKYQGVIKNSWKYYFNTIVKRIM